MAAAAAAAQAQALVQALQNVAFTASLSNLPTIV